MAERLHITAHQLGLEKALAHADEGALFKWLLASFLFAKPIQQSIAEKAYRVIVEDNHCDTPARLAMCTKAELVRMLGEAHYVRFDFSTAERLLKLAAKLSQDYGGTVTNMYLISSDRADFEQRLLAFTGVGPKTVQIFMREAGPAFYRAGKMHLRIPERNAVDKNSEF